MAFSDILRISYPIPDTVPPLPTVKPFSIHEMASLLLPRSPRLGDSWMCSWGSKSGSQDAFPPQVHV